MRFFDTPSDSHAFAMVLLFIVLIPLALVYAAYAGGN